MPTRLVFGLVAASAEAEVSKRFDELSAWIAAHANLELARNTVGSYQELAGSVREGTSDIAWLPPVVYAWLAEAVTPLGSIVREGQTSYAAALVVKEEGEVKDLPDLARKHAGWVDPWSAAGYVVPRLELARVGIDASRIFAKETFFGTHRDALLALARGDCDVVGTYARAQATDDERAPQGAWSELADVRVRVLRTFGSIPTDVIASRRNLLAREHELATEALRKACADTTAAALVKGVFGGHELREGVDTGHDELRRAYERAIANGIFD